MVWNAFRLVDWMPQAEKQWFRSSERTKDFWSRCDNRRSWLS